MAGDGGWMANDIIFTTWIDTNTYPNWTTTTTNNTWQSITYTWPIPVNIEDDCGQPCLILRNSAGTVIGRFYINDNEFVGDVSKSTQEFLNTIKTATADYIKRQREEMVKKIIVDLEQVERSVRHFNNERYGAMDKIIDTVKEHLVAIQSI